MRDWLASAARTIGEIRLMAEGSKVGLGHPLLVICSAFRHRAIPPARTRGRSSKGHSAACRQLVLLKVRRLIPKGTPVPRVGDSAFGTVAVMRRVNKWHWHHALRQKATNQIRVPGQDYQDFVLSEPGQSVWLGRGRLTKKHACATNLLAHWQVGEEEPCLLATDLPDRAATLATTCPAHVDRSHFRRFERQGL